MGNDRIVHANGVDLCVETFGEPADPAILLMGGAASSMDWWEDEFCEQLAAGPRFVIRYDFRDTGRSVTYPPGATPYALTDLAADAIGLLDCLAVTRAHIVGLSMGGVIAQRLAVEHQDRVLSLTLMSTTPAGPGGTSHPELPPISAKLQARFSQPRPPTDWTDRAAVIDKMLDDQKAHAGSLPFDEAHVRKLVGRIFDRTTDMASSANHFAMEGGDPLRDLLRNVRAPTLIIHGTEDPFFPYGHAEALAKEIPGARLLPLDGVGHQFPPWAVWPVVVPALLRHTAGRS